MMSDKLSETKPFWRCEECGAEDHTKAMPKSREKFYQKAEPAHKCQVCKSQTLMPVGF